jgi:hypothetical protein
MCFVLALYEIILLLKYLNRGGSGYQYLINEQYIPEAFYVFTILYMALNIVIGIIVIYFARTPDKGFVIYILATIYLVLKANTCIFGDLIFISLIRIIDLHSTYIVTIIINVIPLLLILIGAIQKTIVDKKLRGGKRTRQRFAS